MSSEAPLDAQSTSVQPGSEAGGSQTITEYINSQLKLEADAREALPYSFDQCTQTLGPLRQNVFSCLTCNPPPASSSDPYKPAGLCYGCSISCHGDHELVELFAHRDFTCDCGTTRLPSTAPCTLRINPKTGAKGPVHSQEPPKGNQYNHNFRNRFCGCGELYDPHKQKGTMYQCMGLHSEAEGGCGEDWWHPECLMGLPRDWYKKEQDKENGKGEQGKDAEEHPVPSGFPDEDEFETLICYKCVGASKLAQQYSGSKEFLTLTYRPAPEAGKPAENGVSHTNGTHSAQPSLKRKAVDDDDVDETSSKRGRTEDSSTSAQKSDVAMKAEPESQPKHTLLPTPLASSPPYSLFPRTEDFREAFCRCPSCYPVLKAYPPLLEEEETYEPPISSSNGDAPAGTKSAGTGSLLERGEAALSNVDRVRAIEGVMVYNHLRDKVKEFLQPFAESGQAVGAEDIKKYFEELRGDKDGIEDAKKEVEDGGNSGDGAGGDSRKEQSGY